MSDDQHGVDEAADAKAEAAPKPAAPKKAAKPAKARPKLPPLGASLITGVNTALEKQGVSVNTADEVEYLAEVKRYVPTGLYWLDLLLSAGRGLPCGRPIEVSGNESCGKTALGEYLIGEYVRGLGVGTAHLLDFECAYDQTHMDCYGVKKAQVLYPNVRTMEDGWNYVNEVLNVLAERKVEAEASGAETDPPSLFVWDSLAQSPARKELDEDDHGDSHVGLHARAVSKGFRKIIRPMSGSDATLIFINQVRDKIGQTGPGEKTDTPGGRAAKFAYTIRLKLAAVETLKKGEHPIGHIIEITARKNKHAPKGMRCKIVLSYKRGIDADWSNFLFFKTFGYLTAAGTLGYRWKGSDLPPFKKNGWGEFAAANPELVTAARDAIYAKVLASMDDGDPSAAPDKGDDEDD